MTEEAKAKRNEYQREYYKKNRERVLEQKRKWARANKDKIKASLERYWHRKAEKV